MRRWGCEEWRALVVMLAVIALHLLVWWLDAHYAGPRPSLA
jgi:hypothetical protein